MLFQSWTAITGFRSWTRIVTCLQKVDVVYRAVQVWMYQPLEVNVNCQHFILATGLTTDLLPRLYLFFVFFKGETSRAWNLSRLGVENTNMFWWRYSELMLRLEQLFLTGTFIYIVCWVKHQWDHLTGRISNTKRLAENAKHLTSIFICRSVWYSRGRKTPVPIFAPTDR